MHRLLHQESIERWAEGWGLAQRLGPPVVPALRAALRQEPNFLKRLVLIGAVAAASRGVEREARLLEIATAKGRGIEDAALALICLAVAPVRPLPPPEAIEAMCADERGSYLAVAAALVSTRFAPASRLETVSLRSNATISEQVAAAVRGVLPIEPLKRAYDAVRDGRAPIAHGLLLRAAFLGRGGRIGDELAQLARQVVQSAAATRDLRVAAALHLGRAEVRLEDLTLHDPHVCAALAQFPVARQELRRRSLLSPSPEVLIDEHTRCRLVSGYALAASWSVLLADCERWPREAPLLDSLATTLAWRALRNEPLPASGVARLSASLASRPAANWLQFADASGAHDVRLGALDERTARIATLANEQSVDRVVIGRELEDALWRAGSHPGLVWHAAWAEFVCDVLLAGSNQVSARLQRDERLPLPRGLEDSHDKFFLVADRVFRFLTERVPEPPPELRLR